MADPNSPTKAKSLLWLTYLSRLAIVIFGVWMMHLGIEYLLDWAEANAVTVKMQLALMAGLVVIYAIAISIPFVPGVEIALSLLVLRGAEIAPWLYLGTVLGLFAAFSVGFSTTDQRLSRFLGSVGLRRPARFVEEIALLSPERRLALMRRALPVWLAPIVVNQRYLVLALLLNLPGNMVIGGGGGIVLLAGLSRLFRPAVTALTIALAVLPVPLVVWLMGPESLGL